MGAPDEAQDDWLFDQERRIELRHLTFFPAFYEVEGSRTRSALAVDLSVSGLRLATHSPIDNGRAVKVRVFVGDGVDDMWEFEGKVVRAERRPDVRVWPYAVGVRFRKPALEREARIDALGEESPTFDADW